MPRVIVPPVRRQLRRVRRRLFFQAWLDAVVRCWIVALVLATGWFLLQPFVLRTAGPSLRWAVGAGLVGLATLWALVRSYVARPAALTAALALDERFNLKERVATSLSLRSAEASGAAAQALLADTNQRVESLTISEKFPIRLRWSAALVPLGAAGLAAVALLYHPRVGPATAAAELSENPAVVAEIEQKFRELQQKGGARKADPVLSADQERINTDLDRLIRQPRETKEQARDVVKEMSSLEERMREREKELADKAGSLKARLEQLERTTKDKDRSGPASDIDKAMKRGNFARAREEAEQLARRLQSEQETERLRKKQKDESLTPEERDRIHEQLEKLGDDQLTRSEKSRLQEQLQDLEQKLERLFRSREEMEQALRELNLSPEELDRELEALGQCKPLDAETRRKLERMAQSLKRARKAMQEGKDDEAARELEGLAKEMEQLDCDGEACRLSKQLAQLQAARRALCRALDGRQPAAGPRPESPEKPAQFKEERARAPLDRGRLQVIDHVPGGGFKGPRKPEEMVEDIRRAAQEAPEAIDRQRLPRSARDMARGYFEKLRGEKPDPR